MFRSFLTSSSLRPTRYCLSCHIRPPKYNLLSYRHFSSSNIRPVVRHVWFSSSPSDLRKWDLRLKLGVGIFVFGSVYYVSHLEQMPETGRWRFMNTSKKFEARFGELARQQLQEEFKDMALPPNHMVSRHVRRVVSRILESSDLGVLRGDTPMPYTHVSQVDDAWNPDEELKVAAGDGTTREWDVMVINNPKMINAQVVPGLIMIYTGILPICKDEQGLASVIAHEIGHVVARHTAERISSQTITLGLLSLLGILGLDIGFSDILQKVLFELPNSRTQELEADRIGLAIMSRACFDPRAAPETLSRLAQIEAKIASKAGMEFLQTHPSSASRVEKLEQLLPEAYAILAGSPECAAIQDQLQMFREATSSKHDVGEEFVVG